MLPPITVCNQIVKSMHAISYMHSQIDPVSTPMAAGIMHEIADYRCWLPSVISSSGGAAARLEAAPLQCGHAGPPAAGEEAPSSTCSKVAATRIQHCRAFDRATPTAAAACSVCVALPLLLLRCRHPHHARRLRLQPQLCSPTFSSDSLRCRTVGCLQPTTATSPPASPPVAAAALPLLPPSRTAPPAPICPALQAACCAWHCQYIGSSSTIPSYPCLCASAAPPAAALPGAAGGSSAPQQTTTTCTQPSISATCLTSRVRDLQARLMCTSAPASPAAGVGAWGWAAPVPAWRQALRMELPGVPQELSAGCFISITNFAARH
jgi:hypothetical protein